MLDEIKNNPFTFAIIGGMLVAGPGTCAIRTANRAIVKATVISTEGYSFGAGPDVEPVELLRGTGYDERNLVGAQIFIRSTYCAPNSVMEEYGLYDSEKGVAPLPGVDGVVYIGCLPPLITLLGRVSEGDYDCELMCLSPR